MRNNLTRVKLFKSMPRFSDFYSSIRSDGHQFEVFVKWFLQNDPEWKTQVEKVWLWNEYPERWGRDCGIDLIFRHKNSEIWAVQAKCYAPEYSITKPDVDRFLSESSRNGIDKRLLIGTTDRIGTNAKNVCDAQEKPVVRFLLTDFENAAIEYPRNANELETATPNTPPTPKPYQLEAIAKVQEGFLHFDRGQLLMACGTGKTYIALWIKERLASQLTLVLVPSLSLLSQTLREWTSASNKAFDVLCVCSDESVGHRSSDDLMVTSSTELRFPVESDTSKVRAFLRRSGDKVIFSTYQSSPVIVEAQTDRELPDFDLAIADEGHRCTAKVGTAFTTILDDQLIRSRKRLFMTATPRTYTSRARKFASDRGVEVAGMDDASLFGPVFHSLSFGEAISKGLLVDYRLVIIGVTNSMIGDWIADRKIVALHDSITTDAEALAAKIGLIKAIRDYDLKRMISFHSRVKRAEMFSIDLQDVIDSLDERHRPDGNIWSDYVSGTMSTYERRIKLQRLKSLENDDRGLLSNARCLSEGVDVPSLDGVAFIDPKDSQVDIVQAVGRAIRLSGRKSVGTIVLPVFIEEGDNVGESIGTSNFKSIWRVLLALRTHDELLSEELDRLRTEMGRQSGTEFAIDNFDKVILDLPTTIGSTFVDALKTYLVEQTTESWNFWFGLLQNFANREKHCLVRSDFRTAEGYALGNWVGTQRNVGDQLSKEKIAYLESMPGWAWHADDWRWEQGYAALKAYADANGNCLVPKDFMVDGFNLGEWVGRQRTARGGKRAKDRLAPERVKRLEQLPNWFWDSRDAGWEAAYACLNEFAKREKHTSVPKELHTSVGTNLKNWIRKQKDLSEKSKLSEERSRRLELILGWHWENKYEFTWNINYQLLKTYADREGTSRIPEHYETSDGIKLGVWVKSQRIGASVLTEKQVALLQELPYWIFGSVQEHEWEERYKALKSYAEREKHCFPPYGTRSEDGFDLYTWSKRNREIKDKLSKDQIGRLEELPGWFWERSMLEQEWEDGYNALKSFTEREKHCRVPTRTKMDNGRDLYSWTNRNRQLRNELSEERIERLEELPGWVWKDKRYSLKQIWEDNYNELKSFAEREKHCRVPTQTKTEDRRDLYSWVNRHTKLKDNLSADQIKRLEELPGWSWEGSIIDQAWEDSYNALKNFAEREKHCRVPANVTMEDGRNLYEWVKRNRAHKDRLSADQIERLEGLPTWFFGSVQDQLWEERYNALKGFAEREKHCWVPHDFRMDDGRVLYQWVWRVRSLKDELSKNRIKRLEELPGWKWESK